MADSRIRRLVMLEALCRGLRLLWHGLWAGCLMFVVGLGGFIIGSDLGDPSGNLRRSLLIYGPVIYFGAWLAIFAAHAITTILPPTWAYRLDNGWKALVVSRYGWSSLEHLNSQKGPLSP